MRVTDNYRTQLAQWALTRTSRRLNDATTSTALGQRVTAPSDDPSAYASAMRQTSQSEAVQAGSRAARLSADALSQADTTLDAVGELLTQAKELAVRGGNDTLSATDRKAIGEQIGAIREQVIALANTRGTHGFLFGGTRTDAPPFSAAGVFQGNDNSINAALGGSGPTIRSNASGARAFTVAGGRDVFSELSALQTALAANDGPGIRAATAPLDEALNQVTQEQQRVGSSVERLRSFADLADAAVVGIERSRSRELGADDLPKLLTELTAASNAYQRSLESTRKLIAMSGVADGG